MDYRVQLSAEAIQTLAGLDKLVAVRITRRLEWLAHNFYSIKPEPLKGGFSDFYKYRIGDYRVLYFVSRNDRVIFIRSLGHRRDVYKQK